MRTRVGRGGRRSPDGPCRSEKFSYLAAGGATDSSLTDGRGYWSFGPGAQASREGGCTASSQPLFETGDGSSRFGGPLQRHPRGAALGAPPELQQQPTGQATRPKAAGCRPRWLARRASGRPCPALHPTASTTRRLLAGDHLCFLTAAYRGSRPAGCPLEGNSAGGKGSWADAAHENVRIDGILQP
jgi:hypothetical protein